MSEQIDQGIPAPLPSSAEAQKRRPPLPPPPSARRGRWVWRVVSIVALVIVGLAGIGAIVEESSSTGDEIFSEDFESDRIGFSTDSDRNIDLRVENGTYRIELREAEYPQYMRHVFTHSYDGLSVEATIVHPDVGSGALAALGCWSGLGAYLFATSPAGDVLLIETVSEATGERRELIEPHVIEHADPAGEPNRLRLDCVGGGRQPTIISAYVNDVPVASVAVDDGLDSFNAVGLFVASEEDDVVFTMDDFAVTSARPEPPMSPTLAP